jgi:lipopolysaccharide transport system ATP-binding protein
VDEALSVGDGAFARKSYERIMALKDQGTTILFCSHSMFQVESLCTRALWLEGGGIRFDGPAHQATLEYSEWLARHEQGKSELSAQSQHFETVAAAVTRVGVRPPADGVAFQNLAEPLQITVDFRSDPNIPCPTLGVVINGADGRAVTSAGNWLDGVPLQRDVTGAVHVVLEFPKLPLLKGRYSVSVYVLCERAINLYASAENAGNFEVVQEHVEQGVVSLPHSWLS